MVVDKLSVKHDGICVRKIFTEAARAAVRSHLEGLGPRVQNEAREPPYMAPSADPDDYSNVGVFVMGARSVLIKPSGARTAMTSVRLWYFAQPAG